MTISDVLRLTKARIALANAIASIAGFAITGEDIISIRSSILFLGIFILAGGASAFNQILEREQDELMLRTMLRPLPAKKASVKQAYVVAVLCTVLGIILLYQLGLPPMIPAIGSFIIYVFIYTPLKKVTPLSLFIGAIVGALPPVSGYIAGSGGIVGTKGIIIGAFMYLYQIPHTLSLFHIFRDDYIKTWTKSLAKLEPEKLRKLIIISLIPALFSGTILVGLVIPILSPIFTLASIIVFIKSIANTRLLFHALNIFMISVLLAAVLGSILANLRIF